MNRQSKAFLTIQLFIQLAAPRYQPTAYMG